MQAYVLLMAYRASGGGKTLWPTNCLLRPVHHKDHWKFKAVQAQKRKLVGSPLYVVHSYESQRIRR
jgi:hypothetical protein